MTAVCPNEAMCHSSTVSMGCGIGLLQSFFSEHALASSKFIFQSMHVVGCEASRQSPLAGGFAQHTLQWCC